MWHWLLTIRQKAFGKVIIYRNTADTVAEANKRLKDDLIKLRDRYHSRSNVGFLTYNEREHAVNAVAANELMGVINKL